MKALLLASAALLICLPAQSETIYLLIKSERKYAGMALHSLPMESLDQCEEVGALVISSDRFDTPNTHRDAFECITGK